MRALGRFLRVLSMASAVVGAAAVVVMMVQVAADVVLRNIFGTPIPLTASMATSWYMVAIAFLPLGLTEILDRNIAVEVVFLRFSRRWRRICGGGVCLVSAIVAGFAAVPMWGEAMERFGAGSFVVENGRYLVVWPGYFLIPIGFAIFGAVLLYRTAILWTGAESGLGEVPLDAAERPDDPAAEGI